MDVSREVAFDPITARYSHRAGHHAGRLAQGHELSELPRHRKALSECCCSQEARATDTQLVRVRTDVPGTSRLQIRRHSLGSH